MPEQRAGLLAVQFLQSKSRPVSDGHVIARDWNAPASGSGYVTRFRVARDFMDRYEIHQAGGTHATS